jgi:hypothetical protein
MKKSILLWLIAFLLTAATAVYQRVTGQLYSVFDKLSRGYNVKLVLIVHY